MKHLFYHTDPLQQLREQGVDLSQSADEAAAVLGAEDESGAPVSGTEQRSEQTDNSAGSSAGTENTDTSQSTGPPESVPYARFKEVNDQLRDYRDVEKLGYDANSVRQLAQWGAQFDQNPVDSFLDLGARIEGLPDNVAAAIEEHLEGTGTGQGQSNSRSQGSDNGDDDGPPDWFKPYAEKIEKTTESVETSEREAIAEQNNKILTELMERWKAADKEASIRSPKDRVMLQYISAVASSAKDLDDVFDKARGEWIEDRDDLLDGTVERSTAGPSSVSGSGAPVREAPPKPQTLDEVNARVEADIVAGNLDMSGIGKRS